jgi:[acyl-carrier-protein] S-malonyltransferase
MLAFTFPGQGSQRPGMGRPWVDHESWELVDEASEVAGRDVARLLLDADADELKDTRNAQLTTFVSSLMVLDAVERLGIEPSFCAGHSLGEYTALAATGALGFQEGVVLVSERAAAMHDAGSARPGTMAAVLGLDDDQVERGVQPRRRRGLGRQLQRARPGRDRRIARRRRGGRQARQGSRRQAGHAAPGVRRLPHHVHGPARDRLRDAIAAAEIRDAEIPSSPTSTPSPTSSPTTGRRSCRHSWRAPCAGSTPCRRSSSLGVTEFAELGPGGVLTGMAKRSVEGARTISVATPDDLDKLVEWLGGDAAPPTADIEGEHLFAVERLVVSPAAGIFTRRRSRPAHPSRSARSSVTSATTRSGRRSAGCCRASSPSTPNA